ncbi:DUF5694 domain-containing protein [Paenibacillus sp. CAU 1782]
MIGKPKVLILGTFHMKPTPDLYKAEIDNLLSFKRQQEIVDLVEMIKKYRPTKIAVEVVTKQNEEINKQFTDYVNGDFVLEANEVHQVGFRIAADLSHKEIYPVDWMEQGAGTRSVGEVYEWTRVNQPELFNSIFGWIHNRNENNGEESYKSITDMYLDCNNVTSIHQHHKMNLHMARIGLNEQYVGVDWLIWWYQRNLIIFSNITRISTSPDDRILLIIGGTHVQILNQFLNESDLFDLENIQNYLH